MRIVKCEKVFLSQNEADIWEDFEHILEGLSRGCENPNTLILIGQIQNRLSELWKKVMEVE